MAPLAPSLDVYLKAPNKYDFPNVDQPDPQLIFSHKTHRQQAADLAKLATKAPVEVWVRNTARHDIENVDTPIHRKKRAVLPAKTHKFRVKRKEVEKGELAEAEKPKEKKPRGRKLPTKEEILEKATEIAMINQVKQGIEPITPETSELLESGVFEEARRELMTGEDTVVNTQILEYVDLLKTELEPMGFSIVPLSEI
jgi:phage gp29-like protein